MRKLNIVFPMLGKGLRFKDDGYILPKPLIEVDGLPMFMKAVNSTILKSSDIVVKRIFIVRQEDVDKYDLSEKILSYFSDATIIPVNYDTRGTAESVSIINSDVKDNEGLMIVDCDLCFESNAYEEVIHNCLNDNADNYGGALLLFNSQLPIYSYAKIIDGYVQETAEKNVISDTAIIGAYFFNKSKYFKESLRQFIIDDEVRNTNEFYVSVLFNWVIKKGFKVVPVLVEKYNSFGTPSELNDYMNYGVK